MALVALSKDVENSEVKDTQDTNRLIPSSRYGSTNRSHMVSNPDSGFFKTEGHEPIKKFVMLDVSLEEARDQDQLSIKV